MSLVVNVSTSLSPTIFQYWFEKHNVDGVYGYVEIQEKDFDQKIKPLLKEGLPGGAQRYNTPLKKQ